MPCVELRRRFAVGREPRIDLRDSPIDHLVAHPVLRRDQLN
jgi:hypothetical protein